jgi:hypothetical protein
VLSNHYRREPLDFVVEDEVTGSHHPRNRSC